MYKNNFVRMFNGIPNNISCICLIRDKDILNCSILFSSNI